MTRFAPEQPVQFIHGRKAQLASDNEARETSVVLTKAELQRLRSLREKKHREALGLFVVEGSKVVEELLAADFPFVELYATSEWIDPRVSAIAGSSGSNSHAERSAVGGAGESRASMRGAASTTEVTRITAAEMARVSHFPTPSPVLAVGCMVRHPVAPADLIHGFTLALDGVQDAGNVGTLLRIADWFGFDRVVLSPDCADLFNQKVINASMGSFARVRAHTVDLAELFRELTAGVEHAPVPILGCDLDGHDVHALPTMRDAVVVIGSEGRGLSEKIKASVTQFVTIPRFGRAESLNAAIAAAVVCDNLRRAAIRP